MPEGEGPKVFTFKKDPQTGVSEFANPGDKEEWERIDKTEAEKHEKKMKQIRSLDDETLRKEFEYWRKTGSGEDEQQWAPGNAYEFSCRYEVMKERGLLAE